LLCDICYFSSTRYSKPPRYFMMKKNKSFIIISLCQTVKTVFVKVLKMWEKMKVFPMLCFTKLFIVTFCPSDQLLCKILCCDFLSYMFCQNAKFKLWLFVLWLFVRDFLSVTFCPTFKYLHCNTTLQRHPEQYWNCKDPESSWWYHSTRSQEILEHWSPTRNTQGQILDWCDRPDYLCRLSFPVTPLRMILCLISM